MDRWVGGIEWRRRVCTARNAPRGSSHCTTTTAAPATAPATAVHGSGSATMDGAGGRLPAVKIVDLALACGVVVWQAAAGGRAVTGQALRDGRHPEAVLVLPAHRHLAAFG